MNAKHPKRFFESEIIEAIHCTFTIIKGQITRKINSYVVIRIIRIHIINNYDIE